MNDDVLRLLADARKEETRASEQVKLLKTLLNSNPGQTPSPRQKRGLMN